MAHCLDGYLHMLSSKRDAMPARSSGTRRAPRSAARGRPLARREQLHVSPRSTPGPRGDMRAPPASGIRCSTSSRATSSRLKVSQFVLSYLGESERMRDRVARVLPSWNADDPGYGFVLGCYAYALEESGDYRQAEEIGRRAVELNRGDIWAAHAVAHVAEMEGRLQDGIEWIASLAPEWRECSNFALHLKWHESLYHLELGQHDRVLALYDREVRAESTDEYLDIANAVSLLWRLEQADVNVGARWRELAARAAQHVDDHALVFVDLHYLMALAAAGDDVPCASSWRHASGSRATARNRGRGDGRVGLPLARAVLAHRNEVVR